MPHRACHSVPLRPSAVCDGRAPRGGSARWGTTVCVGAQAAPHRRPHGPRRGPAVACPPSASAYDPSNLGGERAGGGALQQDGPCHPCPCGQPLTARWSQDELAHRSPPRQGGAGPPCHRPAREGEGRQWGARQRQRRVHEPGLGKARSMHEGGPARRGPRLGLGADPAIPARGSQPQRCGPGTERPGLGAGERRGSHGAVLVRAGEGADARPARGCAPLACGRWAGSPPCRGPRSSAADRCGCSRSSTSVSATASGFT